MKFENFHILFKIGIMFLVLVSISPVFDLINVFSEKNENYSQFFLLDSNYKVGSYPFAVQANEDYSFFVKIVNKLEQSEYYKILVKLANQTSIVADGYGLLSEIDTLCESRVIVDNGNFSEIPFNFQILNTSIYDDFLTIKKVSINGKICNIICSSEWNTNKEGFYFQLFLELWRYDVLIGDFIYDDKTVSLWIKVDLS
ncbi:MAG: hypothetical protein QCH99_08170 [Candidatus Bathyarchaeota archaeon]|nr:hypothetical protein [Candidatus Bathyarchaeum tardum]